MNVGIILLSMLGVIAVGWYVRGSFKLIESVRLAHKRKFGRSTSRAYSTSTALESTESNRDQDASVGHAPNVG